MPAALVRPALDERYGRRTGTRRRDRLLALTAVGVGAGAGLGVLLWIALNAATPAVSAALLGYEVRDSSSVEIRIEIRRDPAQAVRCLLRAQDSDNVTVGRVELEVPPSADRTVALAVVVPTTRLATNGEMEECTAVGRE